MMDRQTGSLWSQITGESIMGDKEGAKLTLYPAVHTTFADFRENYPNGVLLKKPEKGEAGSHYAEYMADSAKFGMFGRADEFKAMPGKDLVYGLRAGDRQAAVSKDYLETNGFALVTEVSPPALVVFSESHETAIAYSLAGMVGLNLAKLKVDGDRISFEGSDKAWQTATGRALSPGAGDLPMVPLVSAYWFAWKTFYPNTTLIK